MKLASAAAAPSPASMVNIDDEVILGDERENACVAIEDDNASVDFLRFHTLETAVFKPATLSINTNVDASCTTWC